MKKTNLYLTVISITLVAFQACKKEDETRINTPNKNKSDKTKQTDKSAIYFNENNPLEWYGEQYYNAYLVTEEEFRDKPISNKYESLQKYGAYLDSTLHLNNPFDFDHSTTLTDQQESISQEVIINIYDTTNLHDDYTSYILRCKSLEDSLISVQENTSEWAKQKRILLATITFHKYMAASYRKGFSIGSETIINPNRDDDGWFQKCMRKKAFEVQQNNEWFSFWINAGLGPAGTVIG